MFVDLDETMIKRILWWVDDPHIGNDTDKEIVREFRKLFKKTQKNKTKHYFNFDMDKGMVGICEYDKAGVAIIIGKGKRSRALADVICEHLEVANITVRSINLENCGPERKE